MSDDKTVFVKHKLGRNTGLSFCEYTIKDFMNFFHGIAEIKDDSLLAIGRAGDFYVLTARLPEQEIFAIQYGKQIITFDWGEKEFLEHFNIHEVGFISDGTWFDKGKWCIRLCETIGGDGLFRGPRNGELDEEMCSVHEFEQVESGYK